MGAWWISWIDFPFSCRKIYILLTCYVTVTEASKQVKCTVTMNLASVYFLSQENYENPRPRIMEPRPEWCWVLIGGLDLGYDWAGQAPPAAHVIVDGIRPGPSDTQILIIQTLHTFLLTGSWIGDQMLHPQGRGPGCWAWVAACLSPSWSIIVVGTGPDSWDGVDGCWVRSVSCISRD